jgi:ubiquinone/menaquinone biosynthesis C-methylase UbiE
VEDYYAPVQDFAFSLVGSLAEKTVLELGCGPGQIAVMLAKKGALVHATDINPDKLEETEKLARDFGVADRVSVKKMNIENLSYQDSSFDLIFSRSILMYVNPTLVTQECHRVLKNGGKAIFLENLRWHPLLFLYRKTLSPYAKGSRYLSPRNFGKISSLFRKAEHQEYYLLSPASLLWLTIFGNNKLFHKSLRRWGHVDAKLLQVFPGLRNLAWMTALICYK